MGSEVYLGMFLSEAYSVLQTHRDHVLGEIIRITRTSLPNIGDKQFLNLYKKFMFWPDEVSMVLTLSFVFNLPPT